MKMKRAAAFLLALMLCVSLLPVTALGEDGDSGDGGDSGVTPVNGGGNGDIGPAPTHEEKVIAETEVADWAALIENNDVAAVTTAGDVTTVKLRACVKTTGTLTVEGTVVLDLNGFGIRYAGDGKASVITVAGGATLTLTDGADTKPQYGLKVDETGRAYEVCENSTFASLPAGHSLVTVTGGYLAGGTGTVYDNYNHTKGGGVYVANGGVFTMSGGTIVGNAASLGGGVRLDGDGSFVMTGGAITRNQSDQGGGVYVKETGLFTMENGTICSNTAAFGGGVIVCGTFTMKDGTISGNTAYNGNGGGVYVWEDAAFTMAGGTITKNTAESEGVGVYIRYSYKNNIVELGTFNVSGSPVVSDNKKSGAAYNVYLPDAAVKVTVVGALTAEASIGVTTKNAPADNAPVAFTSGWSTYMSEADPADFFTSDKGYSVVRDGGEAAVAATAYPVTVTNGTGGGDYAAGTSVTITANEPEAGKVFDKWTTTDGVTFANATSTTTTFTMPAKAVTVTATYEEKQTVAAPTFSPAGGTFTSAQNVTISCATDGATIHYTTDGTEPTESSPVYSAPIGVSETTTIKAIAVKSGWMNSAVASATYSINIPASTYPVTVTNGTGGGDYAPGTTVTITASEPETGKRFKAWTGADGLTFTSGSATTATATFTMPARAVNVTATYEDIPAVPVTGVTLNRTTLSLTRGNTATLTATVAPSNATNKAVTWSSGSPGVATVDANGKVTAVAVGTAIITVTTTDGGKTAQCTVTVSNPTPSPTPSGGGDGDDDTPSTSSGTTTTTANPDGSKTTTTTNADGSKTTVTTARDGCTATVKTDRSGSTVSVAFSVSQKAAEETQRSGAPIQLPAEIAPVAPRNAENAAVISITVPNAFIGGGAARVEIEVTRSGPGVIAMLRGADGGLTPVKECYEGSVILPVTESCEIVIVDNTKTFSDVKANDWFYDNVTFVTAREIFNGTGDGLFTPNAAMTRGMLAQALYNFDRSAAPNDSYAFADARGRWYAGAASWAASVGVVTGTDKGFEGEANVTREAVATMLYRYAKALGCDVAARANLSAFADAASVSDWALEAMRWAAGTGLVNGMDGFLAPQAPATRAQVAAIIERFVENVVN